jgi:hypothetical protein
VAAQTEKLGSMINTAIERFQEIESHVVGKTPEQLHARVALRACLQELRSIAADEATMSPAQDLNAKPAAQIIPFPGHGLSSTHSP